MKRQIYIRICAKYKETGEIFKSKKWRKLKLDLLHIDFILNLINDKKNIGLHLIYISNKVKLKKMHPPYAIHIKQFGKTSR